MRVVKGQQGPLWVALYLLDVWEQDLNTRLKVRRALAVLRAAARENHAAARSACAK